jgi:heme/copper-type cytochrome/quinol oxidase subunit 2
MINKVLSLLLLLTTLSAHAQSEPEMADALRENGKIYVVIAVIGIIFLALVILLVFLERKVKKLEDKLNNK